MARKYQVTRGEHRLGEHDEHTLRALLNAGNLRLTDQCWRPGMKTPRSMADFLVGDLRQASRWWWAALVLIMLAAGSSPWWLRGHAQATVAPAAPTPVAQPKPEAEPSVAIEVRRGTPVIVGRLNAKGVAYPSATVTPLAAHSRMLVVSLGESGMPLRAASGVVCGESQHVLTTMDAISGAHALQVMASDGVILVPTTWAPLGNTGLARLDLAKAAVPLRYSGIVPQVPMLLGLAGHSLHDEVLPVEVDGLLVGGGPMKLRVVASWAPHLAGAALLDARGDVAAVVLEPSQGIAVRSSDLIPLLQEKPHSLNELLDLPSIIAPARASVAETRVEDGSVVVTLRNETSQVLKQVLLYVGFAPQSEVAAELPALESAMRDAAITASGFLTEDQSDEARLARQHLREVTERIESALAKQRASIAAPITRREVCSLQCELIPGVPQTVKVNLLAGTGWSARAMVIGAE